MKFLCAQCQTLSEVKVYRVDGPTLVLVCSACGAENHSVSDVAAAPVAAEPAVVVEHDPFSPPAEFCPRCISKRPPTALSCAACGLTFNGVSEQAFEPSQWLKDEWSSLVKGWHDDQRHDALRIAAMDRAELAPLGRLYRVRLAYAPSDNRAIRGRDEVLRLAVLPQTLSAPREAPSTPTWKYVAVGLVIVSCMVAMVYMLKTMLAAPT